MDLLTALAPFLAFAAIILWGLNHLMAHHKSIAELERRLDIETRVKAATVGIEKALDEARADFEAKLKAADAGTAELIAALRRQISEGVNGMNSHISAVQGNVQKQISDLREEAIALSKRADNERREEFKSLDKRIHRVETTVGNLYEVKMVRDLADAYSKAGKGIPPGENAG